MLSGLLASPLSIYSARRIVSTGTRAEDRAGTNLHTSDLIGGTF